MSCIATFMVSDWELQIPRLPRIFLSKVAASIGW